MENNNFNKANEKSNNNNKFYLNDAFKVVSTQSTAKPGCVLYISDIVDSEHVYNIYF